MKLTALSKGEPKSAEPFPESNHTRLRFVGKPKENPFAEPIPDWPLAKLQWRGAWEFHIFFIGTLFAFLALYTFISLIRLWRMKNLLSKPYFISLNSLVCLFSIVRLLYMFIDGYNSNNTIHTIVNYFLYSIAFPCITSVYSLLFFALLQATQVNVMTRLQKLKILLTIIVFHFVISIATDITVGLFYGARVMLIICEVFSIIWGCFLIVAFFCIFRWIHSAATKRQKAVEQLSALHSNSENTSPRKVPKYTLSLAVKVTFGTSICGVVYVAAHVYGLSSVYNIYATEKPKAWLWWTYHFCLRVIEFVMCFMMAYVATQPFRYFATENSCLLPFKNIICQDRNERSMENIEWHKLDKNLMYKPSKYKSFLLTGKRRKVDQHHSFHTCNLNNQEREHYPDEQTCAHPMLVVENGYIRFRSEDERLGKINNGVSYGEGSDEQFETGFNINHVNKQLNCMLSNGDDLKLNNSSHLSNFRLYQKQNWHQLDLDGEVLKNKPISVVAEEQKSLGYTRVKNESNNKTTAAFISRQHTDYVNHPSEKAVVNGKHYKKYQKNGEYLKSTSCDSPSTEESVVKDTHRRSLLVRSNSDGFRLKKYATNSTLNGRYFSLSNLTGDNNEVESDGNSSLASDTCDDTYDVTLDTTQISILDTDVCKLTNNTDKPAHENLYNIIYC